MIKTSQFKAAWWLKNPHLQTLAAKFFRRNLHFTTIDETLILPDGDFIELAWTEKPEKNNLRPIVVILHGLEGSKDSHYAKGMLSAIQKKGWIAVLMHFRGCGSRPNNKAHSYHSGDTRDITYFTQELQQRFPQHPLFAVGFSLGGNVLTRYLAEQTSAAFIASCVICAPLHLASCSKRINHGFSRIYQKYLVDMLRNSAKEKLALNLVNHINTRQLNDIRSIWQFDQQVTAPINGFASAADYYQQASGKFVLKNINKPCLVIHAADDPFLNHHEIVSTLNLPKQVNFEVSKRGGHVGFISGKWPFKPIYWLEQRVTDYFSQFIKSP